MGTNVFWRMIKLGKGNIFFHFWIHNAKQKNYLFSSFFLWTLSCVASCLLFVCSVLWYALKTFGILVSDNFRYYSVLLHLSTKFLSTEYKKCIWQRSTKNTWKKWWNSLCLDNFLVIKDIRYVFGIHYWIMTYCETYCEIFFRWISNVEKNHNVPCNTTVDLPLSCIYWLKLSHFIWL